MSLARNRTVTVFSWAWRIAILALPWQSRWFQNATLAGWPWEQGRWSVYVSWTFVIATIVLSRVIPVRRGGEIQNHTRVDGPDSRLRRYGRNTCFLAFVFFMLTLATTFSRAATIQWWIQALVLAAFVWTLIRREVSPRHIAAWFVISLLPHVALGLWQYAAQEVVAIKWLGIAAQLPQNLGVSVIEAGPFRTLRAYGGFPHPNIFGGWLAIAFVTSLTLAKESITKRCALIWIFAGAAIAVALVLTYSRGAWIASAVGVILLAARCWRSQFFRVALFSSLIAASIVAGSQQPLLFSRLSATGRLETKSLEERGQSLAEGWRLFLGHPIFGTGPNAELVAVGTRISPAPLEPPHNAYLLALVDVGIAGMTLLGWIVWRCRRWATTQDRPYGLRPTACALLIVGLFDHFLWSYWSGQALVAIVVFFALTSDPEAS